MKRWEQYALRFAITLLLAGLVATAIGYGFTIFMPG